jgi:DNA-binding protein HU-beta
MNKLEMVNSISEKTEFSKKDSEKALSAFIETVKETLLKGEKISLVGFGNFEVAHVNERSGEIKMGERKGEKYVTPEHDAPKFKFSKSFKDEMANK